MLWNLSSESILLPVLRSSAPNKGIKHYQSRNSRLEVFCEKGVLKNFAKFTGKHLYQSPFNKVAGLRSATLLKERFWHRFFSVNFEKILRTPIFIEHLWWLPLSKQCKNSWRPCEQLKKRNLARLTHLFPMHTFSNPWKPYGFLMFSRVH